jgi:pantoate--beta-alanine ligase
MHIISDIEETRKLIKDLRYKYGIIGFVPTMGALHQGHESLLVKAKQECDAVIVSIFVNPVQFNPGEDFDKYPRQLEKDSEICFKNRISLIFAPSIQQMYPEGLNNTLTKIVPPQIYQDKLCGKFRKDHFNGVATVVLKLFNIIQPDKAYFGQKDAQQLIIIKKVVRDLNIPVEIIGCPIIREPDGLAMSSRNTYLSFESRQKALSIYKSLCRVKELYESGIKDPQSAVDEAKKALHNDVIIDYFECLNAESLFSVEKLKDKTLVAIAAKVDQIRLIDNIIL